MTRRTHLGAGSMIRCAPTRSRGLRTGLRGPHRGRAPLVVLVAALVCCAPAHAAFTPFTLASGDRLDAASPDPAHELQADYAYDPAVSADGHYVAFTGSIASKPGVYRKDLATGKLEVVAEGPTVGTPSISEDGRYVSFTTNEAPRAVEGQTSGAPPPPSACTSVYVRDMEVSAEAPGGVSAQTAGAYTLASAANGSQTSLAYEPPATAGQPCGAAAASRVALSGDGSEVVFTILSPSDLTGSTEMCAPTQPQPTKCPTPSNQVAVRDLETQTTTLVSSTAASLGGSPQPVPGGAALTGTTSSGRFSIANGAQIAVPISASTAAISADGGTVAWMGIDVAEQADIDSPPPDSNYPRGYAEPLWRRIENGPDATTMRPLAGGDPTAQDCPPLCTGGLDLGWDTQELNEYEGVAPAFGSFTAAAVSATGFTAGGGFADPLDAVTPQLSANGEELALLSTQPTYGADPNFGLLSHTKPPPANAFVVDMAPGLTRARSITRLTEWGSLDFSDQALAGQLTSIAISPDGTRVAFTTERLSFPLAPPALITPPVSQAKAVQLYEANLQGGTLALVTQGYDEQPANGAVLAASLSGNGRLLALASSASNLVYGTVDEGSDVFFTEELDSPPVLGEQSLTPLPPGPSLVPQWSLSATVRSAPGGGALLLDVSVPGAGRLYASAGATVPVSRSRGRRHRLATIATRQVAHTSAVTAASGMVQLRLTPASRYRSLLKRKGGLYATIVITFDASGHHALRQSLQVSFPRPYPLYRLPKYRLPKHRRPSHKHRKGRR
jgi:Tol biopolymer transport system component